MPVSLSQLKTTTYSPTQDQYRTDYSTEPIHPEERRSLAFRYPQLVTADKKLLAELPIGVTPSIFRARLRKLREQSIWPQLTCPSEIHRTIETQYCRGTVPKVVESPRRPVLVSASRPPAEGVWRSQRIAAVAVAAGLTAEQAETTNRVIVEYPGYGVVRTVTITAQLRQQYQQALRQCTMTKRSAD